MLTKFSTEEMASEPLVFKTEGPSELPWVE
jgi:hypothetical protein